MSRLVVVTSAAEGWSGLAAALADVDVRVEFRPLLAFAPPDNWYAVDRAVSRLDEYSTAAVTSPRAARVFRERAERAGVESSECVWWASGATTAEALGAGLGPVRVADSAEVGRLGAAVAVAEAMIGARVGGPVLFPCGSRRRDELPDRLRAAGMDVDEIVCYHTVLASADDAVRATRGAAAIVVTSPSVAELLARACPPDERPRLVAAGPTTAAAAAARGWAPDTVAEHPTAAALAAALRRLL